LLEKAQSLQKDGKASEAAQAARAAARIDARMLDPNARKGRMRNARAARYILPLQEEIRKITAYYAQTP
jgi:hypothetical protein